MLLINLLYRSSGNVLCLEAVSCHICSNIFVNKNCRWNHQLNPKLVTCVVHKAMRIVPLQGTYPYKALSGDIGTVNFRLPVLRIFGWFRHLFLAFYPWLRSSVWTSIVWGCHDEKMADDANFMLEKVAWIIIEPGQRSLIESIQNGIRHDLRTLGVVRIIKLTVQAVIYKEACLPEFVFR